MRLVIVDELRTNYKASDLNEQWGWSSKKKVKLVIQRLDLSESSGHKLKKKKKKSSGQLIMQDCIHQE